MFKVKKVSEYGTYGYGNYELNKFAQSESDYIVNDSSLSDGSEGSELALSEEGVSDAPSGLSEGVLSSIRMLADLALSIPAIKDKMPEGVDSEYLVQLVSKLVESPKEVFVEKMLSLLREKLGLSKESFLLSEEEFVKRAGILDTVKDLYNPMSHARDLYKVYKYFRDSDYDLKGWATKIFITVVTILIQTGYLISPVDLIPDVLFGIGWIDDIIIFGKIFVYVALKVDSENWKRITGSANKDPELPDLDPEQKQLPPPSDDVIIDSETGELIPGGMPDDVIDVTDDFDPKESSEIAKTLMKVANSLDRKGYFELADEIDAISKNMLKLR